MQSHIQDDINKIMIIDAVDNDDYQTLIHYIDKANTNISNTLYHRILYNNKMNIIRNLVSEGEYVNDIVESALDVIHYNINQFSCTKEMLRELKRLGLKFIYGDDITLMSILLHKPDMLRYFISLYDDSDIMEYESVISDMRSNYIFSGSKTGIYGYVPAISDEILESFDILIDKGILNMNNQTTFHDIAYYLQDIRTLKFFEERGLIINITFIKNVIMNIITRFYGSHSIKLLDYILTKFDVHDMIFNIANDEDSDSDSEDDSDDDTYRFNDSLVKGNIMIYVISRSDSEIYALQILKYLIEFDLDVDNALRYTKKFKSRFKSVRYFLENNIGHIYHGRDLSSMSAHKLIMFLISNRVDDDLKKQIFDALLYKSFIREDDMRMLYEMKISVELRDKIKTKLINTDVFNMINTKSPYRQIPSEVIENIMSFL